MLKPYATLKKEEFMRRVSSSSEVKTSSITNNLRPLSKATLIPTDYDHLR